MIKNYLTTAFRALLRQKGTAFLNIAGLTLGITGSIVLFLLLQYHISFDKHQSNYHRIYRVVSGSKGNNGEMNYTAGIPAVLPPAFRIDFPEAEEVVFTQYRAQSLILIPQPNGENKKYAENAGVVYTESNFFKVFDTKVLSGDVFKSLDEPNEAVITERLAVKYFGKSDVVGEVVKFDDKEFKIGAVISDPPNNTDMPFTLLFSYETIRKSNEEKGWGSIWSDEHCYFLLKEGEHIEKLQSRLEDFGKKHNTEDRLLKTTYLLEPLSGLHFDERFGNYNYNTVGKPNLIAIAIIGLFLIVTACINFINLATAEAVKRSKEVGIRKTLGSTRGQLIQQFIGETALITFMSLVMSLGFAQMGLGILNPFLELQLSLNIMDNFSLIIFLTIIFLTVSLLSGMYPAFVISGFKPMVAIKNQHSNRNSSGYFLRKGLIVTQFFISQLLVIVTIVIIMQMSYFRNKDLGFRKDAIITLPIPEQETPAQADSSKASKMRTLANELSKLSGIEMFSLSFAPPSSGNIMGSGFILEGEGDDLRKDPQLKAADDKFIRLYELELIAGENVEDLDTARSVVVNRKLTEVAGFDNPEDIIGKRIRVMRKFLPVVGVVENFHTTSLGNSIEPTVIINQLNRYQTLSLRINPQSFQSVLPEIQKRWEATYPESIFEYQFLDETIRQFYSSEERSSILLSVFSVIAITIGCLGLFGLASFMANQKTKEIGVRKVLGASVEGILYSFSKEFMKLVVIGFFLAAPVSWYFANQYLDQFAYKIELSPVIFVLGIGITSVIAMLTVGYRSVKAASINPVNSLRSE
jgi:putative ABC transport system permease protein